MTYSVYLRPLVLEDALVSYKWRNNPKVWELTGSRPDMYVTPEIETEWLANILKRENEKRFAVCLTSTGRYIGNIHLANIEKTQAQYSGLFLGEPEFWSKGIGTKASTILVEYAFTKLNVEFLYAFVVKEHAASCAMLKKIGFHTEKESGNLIRFTLAKSEWQKITTSAIENITNN